MRLIRKQGQIAKAKLRHQAEINELQLDKEIILKEVAYENQRIKLENGLDSSDLLATLQQKGASLLKEKINQVNKVVDEKVKQATSAVSNKLKVDQLTSLFAKDKKDKE
ncbi:MAG: hypothetical protein NY202_03085 [Mollicutes bacterium UO1]